MNKKAFEIGMLAIIIITIASFVTIAAVVGRIFLRSDETQAEVMCHDSIGLRASTVININTKDRGNINLVQGRIKAIPPLCKTIDLKIDGKKEEIMQKMADKMARCWYMFGEGRYEEILHDSKVSLAIYNLDEPDNKCFVCYVAMIDEDMIDGDKKSSITSNEFMDYLITKNYDKAGMKYIDYIQTNGGPGGVQVLTNIEPRHAYGITFMAKNAQTDGTLLKWLTGIGKTSGGAAVGTAGALGAVASLVYIGVPASGGVIGATTIGAGVVLACAASVVCGVAVGTSLAVGVIGGYLLSDAGNEDLVVAYKDTFYKTERDLSIVAIDTLNIAQQHCYNGDLAGQ